MKAWWGICQTSLCQKKKKSSSQGAEVLPSKFDGEKAKGPEIPSRQTSHGMGQSHQSNNLTMKKQPKLQNTPPRPWESLGGLVAQKSLPLMRQVLTQLVQTEWSLSKKMCHRCLSVAALFSDPNALNQATFIFRTVDDHFCRLCELYPCHALT
jgi:hypothetical protein